VTRPSPYDTGLDKNAANFVALSPLSHLERSALVYGERRQNWAQTCERRRRMAGAIE